MLAELSDLHSMVLQARAGGRAGDGSSLVAAALMGKGLKPGPMQRQSGLDRR